MNDTAHLLSAMVERDSHNGVIATEGLERAIQQARSHRFRAPIYGLTKERVDLRVYVTDVRGTVIYDSLHQITGKDYSRWNDVKRTLLGKYGARSSISEIDNRGSLFIAAPILFRDQIIGVLSVEKPKSNVDPFITIAHNRFLQATILFGATILLLFSLLLIWITLPIARLTKYVKSYKIIPGSVRTPLPSLGNTEIRDLGRAFEAMGRELEGKRYIENYVETLTHAIKSPVAAIKGAAELLQDNQMSQADRERFLHHLLNESSRLSGTLQQMLRLSRLESMDGPIIREEISVADMLQKIVESNRSRCAEKHLYLDLRTQDVRIQGDPFLVYQIIDNILGNAIEFTEKGGISIECSRVTDSIRITIEDTGCGIPEYALPHIFEKFYSLPRPEDGKKSSGLGLALVKEAMQLYGGNVELVNGARGGVMVTLTFPVHQ